MEDFSDKRVVNGYYNTSESLNFGYEFINKSDLYAYRCSDKGMLLPFISEYTWSEGARATLYLMALLYCFLGVAIISDIFMGAIEKITSKTKRIYMTKDNFVEVPVWSDTVANLTLMSLGSSAPEIMLSIIEIFGNNFESGALGPSTIVGSAAFNLLFISAVCVIAIPDGEVRRIKDIKVFAVTATFSIIAYIWLIFILVVSTKDVVDLWEALVTLLLFPSLVLIAWSVERNFCSTNKNTDNKQIELGNCQFVDKLGKSQQYFYNDRFDQDGLVQFIKDVKKIPGLSDEDVAILAAAKLVESQCHSRMWYRVGAIRSMVGGRKTQPQLSVKLQEVYKAMNEHPNLPSLGHVPATNSITHAIIGFRAVSCAVKEDIGKFEVSLIRSGCVDNKATVHLETIDGTAIVDYDYVGINEMITFESGETEKQVQVQVIDDNQWEPDEEFFIKISLLVNSEDRRKVQVGKISVMKITILDDDEPGIISFNKGGLFVKESIGKVIIPVIRKNGYDGEVSVNWQTKDKTAHSGKDYERREGTLTFKHSEVELNIEIPIYNNMTIKKYDDFKVELFNCIGGAQLGTNTSTTITITDDADLNITLLEMENLANSKLDCLKIYSKTYLSQIKDALNVNGGDIDNATSADYLLHFLTFGWKILFSFVPPPSILGGWLCFIVSITCIGVLTAIISDLASTFGCLVELKDPVTAITFVALGTSLPDTFASKSAACAERTADVAVGNVTGSNAVNVFLGLGVPWVIAVIYHTINGTVFRVEAGGLGFSVGLFVFLSILCIGTLILRRNLSLFGKAELGGPKGSKVATGVFFICLWLIYVLVSSFEIYGYFKFNM